MKNVAVLGSSGGNLYSLGGKYPKELLAEIMTQADVANINISAIQFIGAETSMDRIKDDTKASLYILKNNKPEVIFQGLLNDINREAELIDKEVAEKIKNGLIDGLILMSAHTEQTNKLAILAAAEMKIPIVGTGGTSMANVGSNKGNVIAVSGTTGTTNRTRAISFVASLAKYWDIKYRPTFTQMNNHEDQKNEKILKRINIRGIMISSLPAFISMALILALSKIPLFSGLSDVFDIVITALPVVIAVIAAKQVSDLDEVSIVAGIIAGVLSVDGGIIGGMLGGIGAGLLVQLLFIQCVKWRFPMTTVNIVAGGISGMISGLIIYYILGPIALLAGDSIKLLIEQTVAFSPILAGTIAGLLIWPAILGGVYHAAILPIVLLEMEQTGASFLGAVDMVALVVVAAGINLANIIFPRNKGEAAVAAPGLLINLGFGTFVESAYPFMFSNKIVFVGAILSGGIGGMFVGIFNVKGTAYLPTFVAPFASNHMFGLIIAMIASLLSAFVVTTIANKTSTVKVNKKQVA